MGENFLGLLPNLQNCNSYSRALMQYILSSYKSGLAVTFETKKLYVLYTVCKYSYQIRNNDRKSLQDPSFFFRSEHLLLLRHILSLLTSENPAREKFEQRLESSDPVFCFSSEEEDSDVKLAILSCLQFRVDEIRLGILKDPEMICPHFDNGEIWGFLSSEEIQPWSDASEAILNPPSRPLACEAARAAANFDVRLARSAPRPKEKGGKAKP